MEAARRRRQGEGGSEEEAGRRQRQGRWREPTPDEADVGGGKGDLGGKVV